MGACRSMSLVPYESSSEAATAVFIGSLARKAFWLICQLQSGLWGRPSQQELKSMFFVFTEAEALKQAKRGIESFNIDGYRFSRTAGFRNHLAQQKRADS